MEAVADAGLDLGPLHGLDALVNGLDHFGPDPLDELLQDLLLVLALYQLVVCLEAFFSFGILLLCLLPPVINLLFKA